MDKWNNIYFTNLNISLCNRHKVNKVSFSNPFYCSFLNHAFKVDWINSKRSAAF